MFANLLQSEEARKQIVLIVNGPASGKAKAFPQSQDRLETLDGSLRRFAGLEAAVLDVGLVDSNRALPQWGRGNCRTRFSISGAYANTQWLTTCGEIGL